MMIHTGALVLYKNKAALVTEIDSGEKISIRVSGDERKGGDVLRVREKDIELIHPGPLASLAGLADNSAFTGADNEAVRDAWELLSGGGAFPLRDLSELVFNDDSPQSAWKAWLLVADGLYFSGSPSSVSARSEGDVRAETEKRRERENEARERGAFLKRAGERALELPGDLRFLQDVEALAFARTEKSRTLKELGIGETPQNAHRLLLDCAVWEKSFNPWPGRNGISMQPFSAPIPPYPPEDRIDLTHLSAWAIDSPWSADPDDALSIEESAEGIILYVHVADPAASIPGGSPADLEARGRGATLYLPEGACRMLGEESLSQFALGLADTSVALTFKITLKGRRGGDLSSALIRETEIFPSTVRVSRLSYEEADAKADSDSGLAALLRLGEENFERRLDSGAVNIELPEVHIEVKRDGTQARPVVVPVKTYRSALAVRECMLLAGEAAASWAASRRLPFPYICQETGELPSKAGEGLAGSYQLRRCMRPRSVSAKPGIHWGLGLDAYTQVTSPLRRYTDLLAHQQIRAALACEKGAQAEIPGEEEILMRLASADAAAQAVNHAERMSRLHWLAVFLTDVLNCNGSSSFDGVIVEKRNNGVVCIIPALALEVHVGGVKNPELNKVLKLKLVSVNIPEQEFIFAV